MGLWPLDIFIISLHGTSGHHPANTPPCSYVDFSWANVVDVGPTLKQHYVFATKNVDPSWIMMPQYRRRWDNLIPALGGCHSKQYTFNKRGFNVVAAL